jgi:hypothetical protein
MCDFSHIPGGLDHGASCTEDLEIITGPLITTHSDWPDVIQDIVMMSIRTFGGVTFMDLLFAPGTLPFLLKADKSPHFGNRGPLFAPIHSASGGLAAQGILVPGIEVYSLTATIGQARRERRSFSSEVVEYRRYSHNTLYLRPGPDNTGTFGVKVLRHKGIKKGNLFPFAAHFLVSRLSWDCHFISALSVTFS